MQIKKKKGKKEKQGKTAVDAVPLRSFPVQYMSGNSLYFYKTLSTLKRDSERKEKRPQKLLQSFAFAGA